jgi:hypothetical protein
MECRLTQVKKLLSLLLVVTLFGAAPADAKKIQFKKLFCKAVAVSIMPALSIAMIVLQVSLRKGMRW